MMSRTRIRNVLKWGLSSSLLLLFMLWAASGWWTLDWSWDRDFGSHFGYALRRGILERSHYRFIGNTSSSSGMPYPPWPGRVRLDPPFRISIPIWDWKYKYAYVNNGQIIKLTLKIPLWAPFLVLCLPTFWVWRADWIAKNDLCRKCGYSRDGLAKGAVCPECGKQHKQSTSNA